MSKTYTSGTLRRKAAPRSEKLRGLTSQEQATGNTVVIQGGGGTPNAIVHDGAVVHIKGIAVCIGSYPQVEEDGWLYLKFPAE